MQLPFNYLLHLNLTEIYCESNSITDGSVQLSSVTQSCPTLCDTMDYSTPGCPVHHKLPELAQTHIHQVSGAIHPSRPLSCPSPAFDLSQHQGLFRWAGSLHQGPKYSSSFLALKLSKYIPKTYETSNYGSITPRNLRNTDSKIIDFRKQNLK